MSRLVSRLDGFSETIFATMTNLAVSRGAINVGQGFPDEDGPQSMLDEACRQIAAGNNQYSPGRGEMILRQAVATDRGLSTGMEVDPESQVLITVGATEAITATVLALVEPGREIIVVEPYYDAYAAAAALAGARLVPVALELDDDGFHLDPAALAAAVTRDTAMIIINTPHNPTGIVLEEQQLKAIADIAIAHDLLVLVDEVYEKLVYDGRRHLPLAAIDGMAGRTITVSSAAKCLNVTGWKTGWAIGQPDVIDAVAKAKQFLTFVGCTPVQPAVAHALLNEREWMARLCASMQSRRDQLSAALVQAGFRVYPTGGGYFIVADAAPLGVDDAAHFVTTTLIDHGIAAIPVSPFASSGNRHRFDSLVRFAFCKKEQTIAEAAAVLSRLNLAGG
ncbi:aminotransferase class I/II-fold pyridoxal phosphate-dependent enzyme [Corynebacterium mendelii]|uniref:Aminotransferase class I/II-fold pyridoxal phosphate-dependent enzyme n=1 Tax=Corynebacterium mendelii TaxID=2765362 RepID=A0A939IXB5_9CORY|nr:aminotransferase class I/II-fold pyridoxal phosphate-dependent enzyme [Corynebacterium mendelii]MBN9643507.1 aminotransferase class I/II-fold pyridoxal phosphate-dependent enzyme [Corynebacterium mendelii]